MDIILDKVSKKYGEKTVLEDVSACFRKGGRYCLFGPSGSGKTTLFRLILGLEQPDSGAILKAPDIRFSVQFQEDRLLPWYTVERNLQLTEENPDRIRSYLRHAGLDDCRDLYPEELSGGMKRRVSLIRALMDSGDILMLDEPVRELDRETADRMIRMTDEAANGRTLIFITHDRKQAEELNCTIMPIQSGK